MKKIILLPFVCLLSFVIVSAQDGGAPIAGPTKTTGEKKGWPSSERYAFISECIKTGSASMSEDAARYYCYCMQERVEKKYPTVEAASKITTDDMSTPAWQKDVKECIGGTWSSTDRSTFLSDCMGTAKPIVGEEKATHYCECMLYKVEKAYPSLAEATKLLGDKLGTPEWKKNIQDCNDF